MLDKVKDKGYSLRTYRSFDDIELKSFRVVVKETDILVRVDKESYQESLESELEKIIFRERCLLEEYLVKDPRFKDSLTPCLVSPHAPASVYRLAWASNLAGVGPMAAVAGFFAELVGNFLFSKCQEIIVENGGDIFLSGRRTCRLAILAGNSPFSGRLALEVSPSGESLGVCTSSGTVGHSLSFGQADAAVILAKNVPLADAVATATANLVKGKADVEKAVEFASSVKGVRGALVIMGDVMGARGTVKLVRI